MPMSMPEIERSLKALRLSGIKDTLETRILQAQQGELSFLDAFSMLLQDEMDRRQSRLIERRLQQSGLTEKTTLVGFDWAFNPQIPKRACFDLVTCKFVLDGEDALIIGAPGTGKSHIAKATAHAAIQAGHRVVYREAHVLFTELFEAAQLKLKNKRLEPLLSADLLVIDDLFLRTKLPVDAADDLLEIILSRYSRRKSTLITSNRIADDWGKCLGDNAISSAIQDRLHHRGHLLKFVGKSYRLKEAGKRLVKGSSND